MVYPAKSSKQTFRDVDYEARTVTIHYSAKVEERSVINDVVTWQQAIDDGRLQAETHGFWRDLLPKGMEPNLSSIALRENDRIIVPQYSGTVKISGDVMYPNTVAYRDGKSVKYYINQAGGWGNRAKKSHTYIIYMNGTVARIGYGTEIRPGCEIVVPSKPKNSRLTLPEIMSIGTSTASIATMIASIANLLK